MAENDKTPNTEVCEKDNGVIIRTVAEKVPGTVKWFSLSKQYGFIQRDDNEEDIFVHRSSVPKFTRFPCLWSGLKIECSVVETSKGFKADNVTAPGGGVIPERNIRPRKYDSSKDGQRPKRTRRHINGDLDTRKTYYNATGSANNDGGEGSDWTRPTGAMFDRFQGPGLYRRHQVYRNKRPRTTYINEEVNAISDAVSALNIHCETNSQPGAPGPRRRTNRGRGRRPFGRAWHSNIADNLSNNEPAESNQQAEFVAEGQTMEGTDQRSIGINRPGRRHPRFVGYRNNWNHGNGFQRRNINNVVDGFNGSNDDQDVSR